MALRDRDEITDKMVRAGREAARKHGAGAMREIYKAMAYAAPAARPGHEARLIYENCWHGPGYRDLRMVLRDPKTGKTYDLDLRPADVQRVIYDCADAAKQINNHPPLDWDQYRTTIHWPNVVTWMPGPAAPKDSQPVTGVSCNA